jgi:hypothetical protein
MNTRQTLAYRYSQSLASLAGPAANLINALEQDPIISVEIISAQQEYLAAIKHEQARAVWAVTGPGMTQREVQTSCGYLRCVSADTDRGLKAVFDEQMKPVTALRTCVGLRP